MTVIDVNTASATRGKHRARTLLTTNLEAVAEAARLMRLRNMGGIILIDLIDMDAGKTVKRCWQPFKKRWKAIRQNRGAWDDIIGAAGGYPPQDQRKPVQPAPAYCPCCGGSGQQMMPDKEAHEPAGKRDIGSKCACSASAPRCGCWRSARSYHIVTWLSNECARFERCQGCFSAWAWRRLPAARTPTWCCLTPAASVKMPSARRWATSRGSERRKGQAASAHRRVRVHDAAAGHGAENPETVSVCRLGLWHGDYRLPGCC